MGSQSLHDADCACHRSHRVGLVISIVVCVCTIVRRQLSAASEQTDEDNPVYANPVYRKVFCLGSQRGFWQDYSHAKDMSASEAQGQRIKS